jgi:hypothetical protein
MFAGKIYNAFTKAARCGDEETMRKLYAENTKYVGKAMKFAAYGGHEHIMKICHDEWGAINIKDVSNTMVFAAMNGHTNLVKMCHDEWGAIEEIGRVLSYAAQGGYEDIMRLCHDDWGFDDQDTLDFAMYESARGGHLDMVKLLYEWGARDVDWAMEGAEFGHHQEIFSFLFSFSFFFFFFS